MQSEGLRYMWEIQKIILFYNLNWCNIWRFFKCIKRADWNQLINIKCWAFLVVLALYLKEVLAHLKKMEGACSLRYMWEIQQIQKIILTGGQSQILGSDVTWWKYLVHGKRRCWNIGGMVKFCIVTIVALQWWKFACQWDFWKFCDARSLFVFFQLGLGQKKALLGAT